MIEKFTDRYTSVLTDFFRAPTESDGCSEPEIVAAEKRLRIRLPGALRAFYACAGTMRELDRSQNRLMHLTPEDNELTVMNGHLYFFKENRNAVLWCLNCSNTTDDPPVFQEEVGASGKRYKETDHVSEFLVGMVLFNLALGAGIFTGNGEADLQRITRLKQTLTFRMNFMGSDIFSKDGKILLMLGKRTVFVSGRTKAQFDEMETMLAPKWAFKSKEAR